MPRLRSWRTCCNRTGHTMPVGYLFFFFFFLFFVVAENNANGLAADIGSNLHDKFGKTLMQKVLTNLSEAGNLVEKVNGKQKLYYPEQVFFSCFLGSQRVLAMPTLLLIVEPVPVARQNCAHRT